MLKTFILTASLVALAFTAPSPLTSRITCDHNPELPPASASFDIIATLSQLNWIFFVVPFGPRQPLPGTLPLLVANDNAVMVLQAYDPAVMVVDRLALVHYIPLFREVQSQCLRGAVGRFNEGFFRLGTDDDIVGYISTKRSGLSGDQNGTAISRIGKYAAKDIATA